MSDPLADAVISGGPAASDAAFGVLLEAAAARRRRRRMVPAVAGGVVALAVSAWIRGMVPVPFAVPAEARPVVGPLPHEVLRTRGGGVDVVRSTGGGLARVATDPDGAGLERLSGDGPLLAAIPGPVGIVGKGVDRRLIWFAGEVQIAIPTPAPDL